MELLEHFNHFLKIRRLCRMTAINDLNWPKAQEAKIETDDKTVYFGAMGFEDRSLAFLKESFSRNMKIGAIYAIKYSPHDMKNREEEFLRLAEKICPDVHIIEYNRYSPEDFSRQIPKISRILDYRRVIVDISGLSKLAIVVLLQGLTECSTHLRVFYAEAKTYHPEKEIFDKQRLKISETVPTFLTTNVFDILSTTSLSSSNMGGSPITLVAFPTFNHLELSALLNELSPQQLFLLENLPFQDRIKWRLEAIRDINKNNYPLVNERRTVNTFLYIETLEALEEIYNKIKYTSRLLIAPTGSKMQSLGIFLFKQLHPDIQIIYPVARSFLQEYTEGWIRLWEIEFGSFSEFVSRVQRQRIKPVLDLLLEIDEKQK